MAESSPERGSMNVDNQPRMEAVGICHICKHRTSPYPPQCHAFPGGIPVEILVGNFIHTTPYPGDHGILFEEKGAPQVTVDMSK